MRSGRVTSRGVVQSSEAKDVICTGKIKGSKKVSNVAIIEEIDDLELKHKIAQVVSPSASSPKSADTKKLASVVTPGDEKMKSVSKTSKATTKKGTKGAFGRSPLIEDFGDDAVATRKAPLEVSPLVDIVYR